jgi:hypothetical protein
MIMSFVSYPSAPARKRLRLRLGEELRVWLPRNRGEWLNAVELGPRWIPLVLHLGLLALSSWSLRWLEWASTLSLLVCGGSLPLIGAIELCMKEWRAFESLAIGGVYLVLFRIASPLLAGT